MAQRPTIKLIDNPIAVGESRGSVPVADNQGTQRKPHNPTRRRRTTTPSKPPEQQPAQEAPSETNPYAGMRKVQAPVRLFPPLWDRLEELVRELRDEGLDVDKTALLNATLHFYGPADVKQARELVNRWRTLLARPPAPRA